MGYLHQFRKHIDTENYSAFLDLWNEYCLVDDVNGQEIKELLSFVKGSCLADPFGRHVSEVLHICDMIEDLNLRHEVISLVFDIQSTNTPELRQFAYKYLFERHKDDPIFSEKMRLVGIKDKDSFQGAIRHYEILSNMKEGRFFFHTRGWGVGRVVEVSFLREELSIEFSPPHGKKDISFTNAFKTLGCISAEHFLSLKFMDPDVLEQRAMCDPVGFFCNLLKDMGPMKAVEIRDELCGPVIMEDVWQKWWQGLRARLRKCSVVSTPKNSSQPFRLVSSQSFQEDAILSDIEKLSDVSSLCKSVHNLYKDFQRLVKSEGVASRLRDKLCSKLSEDLARWERLQLMLLLESVDKDGVTRTNEIIASMDGLDMAISQIEIASLKREVLRRVVKIRSDWADLFIKSLPSVDQVATVKFIISELMGNGKVELLSELVMSVCDHPENAPQFFLWYFQLVMDEIDVSMPLYSLSGKCKLLESLMLLLDRMYHFDKELQKKALKFLTKNHYEVVRAIFQDAHEDFIREIVLLSTKCKTLSLHEVSALQSLAEVSVPSLKRSGVAATAAVSSENDVVWVTKAGYERLKDQINNISAEIVKNTRDIEVARGQGDLSENADYSAAKDRGNKLHAQLSTMSSDMRKIRIIEASDVVDGVVSVGSRVLLGGEDGMDYDFIILGPYDGFLDESVISFQSNLAKELLGKKQGDSSHVKGSLVRIKDIRNYIAIS